MLFNMLPSQRCQLWEVKSCAPERLTKIYEANGYDNGMIDLPLG